MIMPIGVALIAPGSLTEQYCGNRLFQMALAGNLVHANGTAGPHPKYVDFYNQSWKPRGREWLLDNGAWETETLSPEDLLRVANRCHATEVMAPDVLYDVHSTWKKTEEFLAYFKEAYSDKVIRTHEPPRVAVIAHGRTIQESMDFVCKVADKPEVKTIAISRTTCYRSSNPTARYELALSIKRGFGERFKVHLLGFSDDWPTELQHCAAVPGLVRSIDTVAPFTYAYAGLPLNGYGVRKEKAPRPDNYFQLESRDFDHDLIFSNIRALDRWAKTSIQDWV